MSVDLDALVVDPGFRLMNGMVLLYPGLRPHETRATVVKGTADCAWNEQPICYENGITRFGWDPPCGWLPDLDDHATCGCFETLNREAWKSVGGGRPVEIVVVPVCRYDERDRPIQLYAVHVMVLCDTWRIHWGTDKKDYQSTRGLALAHALLAAPRREVQP